jgi:hypothetical protein
VEPSLLAKVVLQDFDVGTGLNEQFNTYVKKLGQLSCVCFADGSLTVKDLGGDAF